MVRESQLDLVWFKKRLKGKRRDCLYWVGSLILPTAFSSWWHCVHIFIVYQLDEPIRQAIYFELHYNSSKIHCLELSGGNDLNESSPFTRNLQAEMYILLLIHREPGQTDPSEPQCMLEQTLKDHCKTSK